MFGLLNFFASPISWAAIAAFALGGAFYAGDHHGYYAHKYKAVMAALEKKNVELENLRAADAAIAAAEVIADAKRLKEFKATKLKQCLIDKDQAEALNKLRGG